VEPRIDESVYQSPALTPAGPGLWNFGFFALGNGLPERMVSGREDTWIAGFVDWLEVVKGGVDPDAEARGMQLRYDFLRAVGSYGAGRRSHASVRDIGSGWPPQLGLECQLSRPSGW
jgi:hypothetical protein